MCPRPPLGKACGLREALLSKVSAEDLCKRSRTADRHKATASGKPTVLRLKPKVAEAIYRLGDDLGSKTNSETVEWLLERYRKDAGSPCNASSDVAPAAPRNSFVQGAECSQDSDVAPARGHAVSMVPHVGDALVQPSSEASVAVTQLSSLVQQLAYLTGLQYSVLGRTPSSCPAPSLRPAGSLCPELCASKSPPVPALLEAARTSTLLLQQAGLGRVQEVLKRCSSEISLNADSAFRPITNTPASARKQPSAFHTVGSGYAQLPMRPLAISARPTPSGHRHVEELEPSSGQPILPRRPYLNLNNRPEDGMQKGLSV